MLYETATQLQQGPTRRELSQTVWKPQVSTSGGKKNKTTKTLAIVSLTLLLWACLILPCVRMSPFETSAFFRELLCVSVPWQGVLASLRLLSHIWSLATWPSPWQLCQQHPLCFLLYKSADRCLHVQIFLVSHNVSLTTLTFCILLWKVSWNAVWWKIVLQKKLQCIVLYFLLNSRAKSA